MNSPARNVTRRRAVAFTLIEVLCAIAIVMLLAGILSTALVRAKVSAARKIVCVSNLRQLHAAYALYAADYDGALPPYQNSLGVGHFDGKILHENPENGEKLVTTLHPYLKNRDVWFCPADNFARTDSTVGFVRHLYSSYKVQYRFGLPVITGNVVTFDDEKQVSTSKATLMTDNLMPYSRPDSAQLPYSHNGMYNTLFMDGHVKTRPWQSASPDDEL